MPDADLAILLFWLTLFSGAVFETVKAETLRRRIGFAIVASIFLLSGIFWPTLKSWWPYFTDSVDSVARNPETWFIICVLVYAAVAFWSPKTRADSAAIEARLKKMRAEIADEIAAKIADRPPFTGDKPWKDDVESMGSALEKYVDSLRSDLIASLAEALKATAWKADIDRLNELGVAQHSINDAFEGTIKQINLTVKSDLQQADLRFRMVSTAVRARDTIAILKEADGLVSSLGPRLIAASTSDYPEWKKWNTDYALWQAAFENIDDTMNHWKEWTDYESPFLGLRQRDYERASNLMPPANIVSDVIDMGTRYKNVCLIYPRWEKAREQIFKFLKSSADTLPG